MRVAVSDFKTSIPWLSEFSDLSESSDLRGTIIDAALFLCRYSYSITFKTHLPLKFN